MDDLDFLIDDEHDETEDWFCDDCNMGPLDANKTKCPRCGFKHKSHFEREVELDDMGEPIDHEFYDEHY